jgi:hypothetical protein
MLKHFYHLLILEASLPVPPKIRRVQGLLGFHPRTQKQKQKQKQKQRH